MNDYGHLDLVIQGFKHANIEHKNYLIKDSYLIYHSLQYMLFVLFQYPNTKLQSNTSPCFNNALYHQLDFHALANEGALLSRFVKLDLYKLCEYKHIQFYIYNHI